MGRRGTLSRFAPTDKSPSFSEPLPKRPLRSGSEGADTDLEERFDREVWAMARAPAPKFLSALRHWPKLSGNRVCGRRSPEGTVAGGEGGGICRADSGCVDVAHKDVTDRDLKGARGPVLIYS